MMIPLAWVLVGGFILFLVSVLIGVSDASGHYERRIEAIHDRYKKELDEAAKSASVLIEQSYLAGRAQGLTKGRDELLADIASVVPEFRADDEEDEEE